MISIPIPKEMVNDDAYLVVALLAEPGSRVTAGQPLAELESSKSVFSVSSPGDGYFLPDFSVGQMAPVGANLGVVSDSLPAEDRTASGPPNGTPDNAAERDPRFSLAAWELFAAHGLPPDRFAGMNHIRRSDVEAALTGSGGAARLAPAPLSSIPDRDKRNSLIMLGGGGHCRECIDIIELAGEFSVLGVVDTRAAPGATIAGYPVLGGNEALEKLRAMGIENLVLAYGISGDHRARGRHFEELSALGHRFPAIVHPKAAVSRRAELGRGVQVMAGALVGSGAKIGDACIVNSNCVISHDCRLAENVHVAPGAALAGATTVGRDTVIGMGATIYMRVRVGAGVIIHNGANIFADVPDGTTVRGEWNGL